MGTINREVLKTLLEALWQKYSENLGIRLKTARNSEVFKWFLAVRSVRLLIPRRRSYLSHDL